MLDLKQTLAPFAVVLCILCAMFVVFVIDPIHSIPQAQLTPLQLTIAIEKDSFNANEEIPITVKLENVSWSPLVVPQIDSASQQTYIHIEVVHESGTPIFFLDPFAEKPLARAGNTQVLPAGAELVFVEVLNSAGVGPLGYPNPGKPQLLSGDFNITATFVVNQTNLPLAGDAAVFRGTISSTDSAPPTMINIISKIRVAIDIKPGSFPNSVNPKSKDVIPVAILTTDTFDATTVDPLSVNFGPNGATEAHRKGHTEDADGDGDNDLVLHFSIQDTGIQCGDTSASLTGETFGGQAIEGSDSIRTVGCK